MANPIIGLEVMQRFRRPIGAWGIPLLVLLPSLAVTIIYATTLSSSRTQQFGGGFGGGFDDGMAVVQPGVAIGDLQGIGTAMFFAVLGTLLLALMIMVPALVGGSIAGERHNQTLQPLQLTALTPTQIVGGKLITSLGYLFVVLLCAAPALSIPFLLGGLTVSQVLGSVGVLLLVTVELAAISLAASAVMKRPASAILTALLASAALTVVPWIVTGVGYTLAAQGNMNFDAQESTLRYLASPSPVALGSWAIGLGGEDVADIARNSDRVLSLLFFVVVTVGCLAIARNRVIAPVERDR